MQIIWEIDLDKYLWKMFFFLEHTFLQLLDKSLCFWKKTPIQS